MTHYWMEEADRVNEGVGLIGEDENGDLFTRARTSNGPPVWVPLDWWAPDDAIRYLWSRLRRKIVWLESIAAEEEKP